MKKIVLLIAAVALTSISFAQNKADTSWKTNGDISLMFSQSSFSNWASGGENSLTLNGFFNYYLAHIKGNHKWENMLNLAYGQTKTGDLDYRKSEDKIDFSSIYGLKAKDKWFYSLNLNFKSQFAEGFDYHDGDTLGPVKISNFLAPAYLSVGPGMEYRPKDYMSFYFSPVTARWIIVNDQDLADAGAFGVDPMTIDDAGNIIHGKKSKSEFGSYFRFLFVKDIIKNVNFSTKLELFSNYLDNPGNIDVNWDNMLNLKVNDWISASVGVQMVYDDDTPILDKDGKVGPRTQIKQLLSVGLTYKFAN